MADVTATASLDASGIVKGAKQAGDALGKFGLNMDGVLTKLARQLSATDIAAGLVFAGIAKGQAVMRDSIKAYEDQQRQIEKTTGVQSAYLQQLDQMESAIKRNNETIGESASKWKLLGSETSLALSNMTTSFSEFMNQPSIAAFIKVIAFAAGANPLVTVKNRPSSAPWGGTPSGGGSSGAGGYDDTDSQSRFDSSNFDRQYRNYMRDNPRRPSPFGGGGGNIFNGDNSDMFGGGGGQYNEGATSQMREWQMDFLKQQREAFEESEKLSAEWNNRFSGSINNALLSVLTNTQSFGDAFKSLWQNILAQILQETVTQKLAKAGSSFLSSRLGGGSSQNSPTRMRIDTQRTNNQLNYLRARGAA